MITKSLTVVVFGLLEFITEITFQILKSEFITVVFLDEHRLYESRIRCEFQIEWLEHPGTR